MLPSLLRHPPPHANRQVLDAGVLRRAARPRRGGHRHATPGWLGRHLAPRCRPLERRHRLHYACAQKSDQHRNLGSDIGDSLVDDRRGRVRPPSQCTPTHATAIRCPNTSRSVHPAQIQWGAQSGSHLQRDGWQVVSVRFYMPTAPAAWRPRSHMPLVLRKRDRNCACAAYHQRPPRRALSSFVVSTPLAPFTPRRSSKTSYGCAPR